jgi:AmiR/NasT family two-component response regulator
MAQQLPLDELSTVIARIQGLLLTEEKVATAVRLPAQAAKESVPACGVLMERLGVPHKAALQQLMKQAREERTTLQNVSESILAGTPASGD